MLWVFVHEWLKIAFILDFLPILRELSLVGLYPFEETYASLQSPVQSEDNGFGPNSIKKYALVITVKLNACNINRYKNAYKVIYCVCLYLAF